AVTGKLPFGVDGCIQCGRRYILIQIADMWPLPERLIRAKELLGPDTSIVVLACGSADAKASEVASHVAESALMNGFGLAMALPTGVVSVFPPHYSIPTRADGGIEFGHIPKALLNGLN